METQKFTSSKKALKAFLKVSLQDDICFLGQRWNIASYLLQRRCKNHSKLLHIFLGQSEAGTVAQMVREAFRRCVVSPGQCLLTHGCHHTPEVGWSALWSAEIPYLFTWSRPFRLPIVSKLWKISAEDEIFDHWGWHICSIWMVCSSLSFSQSQRLISIPSYFELESIFPL